MLDVSKLFLKLLCVSSILLVTQLPITAMAQQLSEEFIEGMNALNQEMKAIQGKSLLEKIIVLESLSEKHKESEILSDLNDQVLVSEYARAGEYELASRNKIDNSKDKDDINLNDYVAVDAVEHINRIASNFNVVMINEAHHLPQHRILTIMLLDNLWKLGYRYLALEALPYEESQFSSAEVKSKGGYIDEPIFRYMLRYANQLGFKLISYDGSSNTDLSDQGILLREVLAADKIYEKTFENDESAKVIIHVGYGHINEKTKLGGILKSKLKREILTVSQTDRIEQNDLELENETYTAAEKRFGMKAPYLLLTEEGGEAWSSSTEFFDLSVFWPRVTYINGRPTWARLGRHPVSIDIAICQSSFPCIIELFSSTDFDLTPNDRMLVKHKAQKVTLFATCEDKYVRAISANIEDGSNAKLPTIKKCDDL